MAPALTAKSWLSTTDFYATNSGDPTFRAICALLRDVIGITDDPKVAAILDDRGMAILREGWSN